MMGKDCERMLSEIIIVKDAITNAIKGLSGSSSYRIITKGSHGEHSTDMTTYEDENIDITSYVTMVTNAYESFKDDNIKMNSLESNMYTDVNNFNNSYGSPWKELHTLEESINNIIDLDLSNGKYMGGKIALLGLMNVALSCVIDAKWALITYHDYIQRGFDSKFNGNIPSVTFKKANNQESTGNISQTFDENVNIPEESIDPY